MLSPEQIDARLMILDRGVDFALERAKIWSKYAKDVLNYVEKRTCMQMELAKNLTKLVQSSRPQLQEEIFLPFQSIYCLALDQDLEMCALTQASCGLLQGCKVPKVFMFVVLYIQLRKRHPPCTLQKCLHFDSLTINLKCLFFLC